MPRVEAAMVVALSVVVLRGIGMISQPPGTVCCRSPIRAALSMMVAGSVTTHAKKIPEKSGQSTAFRVRSQPMPQTDPT